MGANYRFLVEDLKAVGPGLRVADNKLIQHASQWGTVEKGVALSEGQLGTMRKLANHIYKNANTIRQGSWGNPAAGGFSDALFYSNGKHIIVTQSNGNMITILRMLWRISISIKP